MRDRWKQAGLILLSAVAVGLAITAAAYFVSHSSNRSLVVAYGMVATVSILAYLAATRWIERRPQSDFSLGHAVPVLIAGVLVGIAMFALVMAILWVAGAYRAAGWNGAYQLGVAFVFWLAVATQEEILFRALLFRLGAKIIGTWGALILSAVVFGGVHGANADATLTGLCSVALAGAMLGAAYAATGRLWVPIGIHTGWNFAEGSLFGTEVSGNNLGPGLILGKLDGPVILTGGKFGPEASIVTVAVVLAVALYFAWRIVKLRRAEPPIWSAPRDVATSPA